MKTIVAIILIPVVMLAAGSLVGTFALPGQKPAEASVPVQMAEPGAGWSVRSFRTITFDEESWRQLGQNGSCVIYNSRPVRAPKSDDRRYIPAPVTVVTQTEEFTLHYPFRGARVTVCSGFTVFLPPLSSGIRRQ